MIVYNAEFPFGEQVCGYIMIADIFGTEGERGERESMSRNVWDRCGKDGMLNWIEGS